MSGVKAILSLAFSKERVESMKVLMLNGSAKKEGNTYQSLLEVGKELERHTEYEEEDGLITAEPGVVLVNHYADSVPLCLRMTKSMNSWQCRKRRTDLSSVHRSIMHIQVDGSCHFWTEYFIAAAEHLPSNRRLL